MNSPCERAEENALTADALKTNALNADLTSAGPTRVLPPALSNAHTPGPWWVTDYGVRNIGGYICATTHVQRYEGQGERFAQETAQREADMRLIAAAPELLDACRKALYALKGREHDGFLRAAITKAIGADHA